jgi:hypothetical protein
MSSTRIYILHLITSSERLSIRLIPHVYPTDIDTSYRLAFSLYVNQFTREKFIYIKTSKYQLQKTISQ